MLAILPKNNKVGSGEVYRDTVSGKGSQNVTFKPWHDENEEQGKNDPGRGNSKCNGPGARTRLSIFRNSKEAIVAGRVTKVRRLGT